jgi:hypothetical protein
MRLLIVTAISTLLLISGAFAQSNSPSDTPSERAKSETQELEKARSEAQRGNSDIKGDKQNAAQTEAAQAEHPGWYSENKPYRPCPAVAAINGRNICLGCPGRCPYPPLSRLELGATLQHQWLPHQPCRIFPWLSRTSFGVAPGDGQTTTPG